MNKEHIRRELLNIRNNLNDKDELSSKINFKVIDYIKNNFSDPKVASFVSLKNEVNTSLINNNFRNIYLPIVHPFIKHSLWFAKDSKEYYLNKYRIKEPRYSVTEIISAWELDIIIVPIVGFNRDKFRMGMGGGFYDYTLSFKKNCNSPLTIGIAFDEQQNDDIIIDIYDIKLDLIITPTRIL
ncbi:5-formyltetrahydrofolate cyclo-ligase [Francisella philomiragia]|uniref:5-formyltetrahydrofolate cyclo-ligase n=1 Tax=Francisella philomiragia TaxID=28110 RepID=A0ABS1GBJ5_9GAMM|nr:5-formyltetrahydrofolate cyclo-ligase [Francisella philomiragia]AJI75544.1 5-formyltetrahydrofolate cyclo-ligase [Francisella philomiragia subsp. philomiragia ATCC 25015]EET21209.1 5-formyltetrahydroformate cycloligase family protein [Francisella philomiragia subsp. philomiragia ATCC 25015]MBK2238862.1 5-formyltetrahydrofolate cyclo-ligase [Francisella philomiragia]MBK2258651.1 5-formyltetrahydrofolate cyclo-ligase [Francisella philomiragia]MBK2302179.1 5-formyltetrahydrofolate cyclo-ligase